MRNYTLRKQQRSGNRKVRSTISTHVRSIIIYLHTLQKRKQRPLAAFAVEIINQIIAVRTKVHPFPSNT